MSVFSEFDPVEFIVSYAARPASPAPSAAPSTSTTTCTAAEATFLDLDDEDEEAEADGGAGADFKIRSRWSCSTLATLAPSTTSSSSSSPPPSPGSASARLRFHLTSVARRVRARRAGGKYVSEGCGEDDGGTASIHGRAPAPGALHVRSSSESALSGSSSAVVCSDMRRKPIPLELFAR